MESNKYEIIPVEFFRDIMGPGTSCHLILEDGNEKQISCSPFSTTYDLYCHVLFQVNQGPFKLFFNDQLIIPSSLNVTQESLNDREQKINYQKADSFDFSLDMIDVQKIKVINKQNKESIIEIGGNNSVQDLRYLLQRTNIDNRFKMIDQNNKQVSNFKQKLKDSNITQIKMTINAQPIEISARDSRIPIIYMDKNGKENYLNITKSTTSEEIYSAIIYKTGDENFQLFKKYGDEQYLMKESSYYCGLRAGDMLIMK